METGNPLFDNPALKAQIAASMVQPGTLAPKAANITPPSAAIAAPIQMPTPAPQMVQSASPSVKLGTQPKGTLAGDQQALQKEVGKQAPLESAFSDITKSKFGSAHPLEGKVLGTLAQIPSSALDIGLSSLGVGGLTPGTSLNRGLQIHGLENRIAGEEKNQQAEATTGAENARTGLEQAQTEAVPEEQRIREEQQSGKEQAEQDKLTTAYRKLGLDAQGQPIPREQLSPAEQATLDQKSSLDQLHSAQAELARAKAAGIPEQIKLAEERLAQAQNLALEHLGIEREGLSLREGQANGDIPTTQMRNMGEMAATVLPQMKNVKDEVDQLATSIGPAVGRWNQFMVNKGGTDFPQFAGLDQDLDLLASAIVRTHFGARGGQQYREELRKMFGEAQSPEDLKARIDHAASWIEGYAKAGGAKLPENGNSSQQEPPRPSNVPEGYKFNAHGPKGAGWYAPTAK